MKTMERYGLRVVFEIKKAGKRWAFLVDGKVQCVRCSESVIRSELYHSMADYAIRGYSESDVIDCIAMVGNGMTTLALEVVRVAADRYHLYENDTLRLGYLSLMDAETHLALAVSQLAMLGYTLATDEEAKVAFAKWRATRS